MPEICVPNLNLSYTDLTAILKTIIDDDSRYTKTSDKIKKSPSYINQG